MVNSFDGSFVVASLLWGFQVLDVPDVSHGVAVCGWAGFVVLVVFVVEDEVFLVVDVEDPALVRVGCSFVGGAGDDACVFLVGHVVAVI